ncbi:MAG: TonB-dependent receptor [Flavobacteriaceae bacterium]|nr:TonB-dependent receptor [Flavobacteriaceae bacterium]
MKLQSITEFTHTYGTGTNIDSDQRNQVSEALIFTHFPTSKFRYNIKIRKDFNSKYEIPFVYALGAEYKFSEIYSMMINGSKNFRTPTFNDLYWTGLGNPELNPETSYQVNFGHQVSYQDVVLNLSGFVISTEDLIKWQPQPSGVWQPVNVNEVNNYGIEVDLSYAKQFANYLLKLNSNYTYTKAIDSETDLQVIYVPEHLFHSNLSLVYKKWQFFYQFLYNGKVYITTDNENDLDAFDVSNAGVQYQVFNTSNNELAIGLKVNNLYNEIYQNVTSRPMPNRNINLNINYNF